MTGDLYTNGGVVGTDLVTDIWNTKQMRKVR